MHSGYQLSWAVVKAIQFEVPGIFEYLEKRMKEPNHLPVNMNNPIDMNLLHQGMSGVTAKNPSPPQSKYAVKRFSSWNAHSEIKKKFFKQSSEAEREMEIKYFDIPYIDQGEDEGYEFIMALNEIRTHNPEEIGHYKYESVNFLLQQHWNLTFPYFVSYMLAPFLITLIATVCWNNLIIGQERPVENMVVCGWIVIFCIQTIVIEIVQIKQASDWSAHFFDTWNQIDLLNVTSLLFVAGMQVLHDTDTLPPYFWGINSLCSLIIWFKLFYYVQAIGSVNWLVQMIIKAFTAMIEFLLILLICIFAFGSAYSAHSNYIEEDYKCTKVMAPELDDDGVPTGEDAEQWSCAADENRSPYIENFWQGFWHSWLLALGEFEQQNLDWSGYDAIGWMLFFANCMVVLVIMMNLLISIFSNV
jgi:hypothetical protein